MRFRQPRVDHRKTKAHTFLMRMDTFCSIRETMWGRGRVTDNSALMWGDGSKPPRETRFRWQFEPDGEGFLYRKAMSGRGVRVSRREYVAFVRAHETRIFTTIGLAILVWILSTGLFIALFEGVLAADPLSDTPKLLAAVA